MKVLVVGNGGREHALLWKLAQSKRVTEVFCASGNAGTYSFATNVEIDPSDISVLALWAVEHEIDLTVVGPEAPLSLGIVDVFKGHGLRIFGPSKKAAQLESSKIFSKEVMLNANVNTPKAREFSDYKLAKEYVESQGAPIVIKADGLAAGKGVVVSKTVDEALTALEDFMLKSSLSSAGKKVLVEECIVGKEASIMALVDNGVVLPLVVSQDYKCLLDGDKGPNTGGMGAVSPTPVLGDITVERLVEDIFVPVINELDRRGISYSGFLYAGVIVDEETSEVKVLEFNCRLGDPETQVILPRLESDLFEVLYRATTNRLNSVELRWKTETAACVVASSEGYPSKVKDNKLISGIFEDKEDMIVFQAGTYLDKESKNIYSKGGRVLCVSALGENLNEALEKAYSGLNEISFDGMFYRKDIGKSSF